MSETNHGRPDENDLVRRVCRDEAEAVSAFYCEFLLPVARVVVRHFSTRAVEDRELANSFFLLLSEDGWRRLRGWEGRNLSGWLWRGCSRHLLRSLQDSARSVPLVDEHEARLRKDDPILESMLVDETGFQLLAAIELLEMRRDRDVIRMHYLESRSLPDIAAALGVPVGTLYVVKARALARLRSILEGRATNAGAPRT